MEFRILGPLEALDGERPVALPRGRGRVLLARLILDAGRVVSTERLIDDLWGEAPPPTVQTALQGLVSDLRKRLEPMRDRGQAPALLRTAPPGYVLAGEPACVDANRFRRLLEAARAEEGAERSARLREALALWRGPALADFTYEPFAQREIAALEELRLAAIEERIDADLALGRESEVVAELEAFVAVHPFRERVRAQLMLALYRRGGRRTRSRSTGTPAGRWSRNWGSSPERTSGGSSRRFCARIPRSSSSSSRAVRSGWRRRRFRIRLPTAGYWESADR